MASKKKPKPGDPDYKGPVHEVLRGLRPGQTQAEKVARANARKAQTAALQRGAPTRRANTRLDMTPGSNVARQIRAKAAHKAAGTRYDPLSSISVRNGASGAGPTARTRKVGKVAKKVAARSGMTGKAARAKARQIIKKRPAKRVR